MLRQRQPRIHDNTHLDFIRASDLLTYEPSTGEFLWRKNRGGTALAGSVAGTRRKDGYVIITVGLKGYYAQRLAWLFVHQVWPSLNVDHIDGNPSNNKIENLRLADQSHNLMNTKIRSDNKSGFKGVSWSARDFRWKSYITINGKPVGLGSFYKPEDAHAAYCAAAEKHYGAFRKVG